MMSSKNSVNHQRMIALLRSRSIPKVWFGLQYVCISTNRHGGSWNPFKQMSHFVT